MRRCWDCAYLGACQIYGKPCEKFKKYNYIHLNMDKISELTGITVRTLFRYQRKGLKYLLDKIENTIDDEIFHNYYWEIEDYFIQKEKQKLQKERL